MTSEQRIEALEEAQRLLSEAVALITEACHDLPDWGSIRNYVIAPIEMAASRDNQWVTRDMSIDDVIEGLEDLALDMEEN